jgi:putative endonuclease
MTNRSKTLYTGITSKLENRVFDHENHTRPGFTSRYKVDRLVYFERFGDVHAAIAREKQIKGLLRIKKMALIVSMNPEWKDLSEAWYQRHQFQPEKASIPRRKRSQSERFTSSG